MTEIDTKMAAIWSRCFVKSNLVDRGISFFFGFADIITTSVRPLKFRNAQ